MDANTALPLLIFSGIVFTSIVLMLAALYKVYKISKDLDRNYDHNRRLSRKLSKNIEEKADEQISIIFSSFEKTFENEIKKHLAKLADQAQVREEEMTKFIEDQQTAIERESQFLIANSLQKITKRLDEYQKRRLAEVDDGVRQILLSASREVLGRSISLTEHEQLVREAIERAKKDKLFS